ncbi:MAG TPA: MBL fold metallo-hydrolase [Pseudomonadales bacterium]|nr:MBL fold metallo-hydrolase [Pseudomonadales bacterium]
MRFASLGSGSKGNATLVATDETLLLLDCGFGLRQTVTRLQRAGVAPEQLNGIIVTHEHSDHIQGVAMLARKFGVPVYASPGTARHKSMRELDVISLKSGVNISIRDIEIEPVDVPHDAEEPLQFCFNNGRRRIGVLTDIGLITPKVEKHFGACDALFLECNHDMDMLACGPYPYELKQRVGGWYGHLNNDQSAQFLLNGDMTRLRELAIAHISEKNNQPDLARKALATALGCDEAWIQVADQENGLPWIELI